MYALMHSEGLTAEQLASITGKKRQSVLERLQVAGFSHIKEIENPAGKGRPVKIYPVDCLKLWGKYAEESTEQNLTVRKGRADKGLPRGVEDVERFRVILRHVEVLAKEEFLKSALQDIKNAIERAVRIVQHQYATGELQRLYGEVTQGDMEKLCSRFKSGELWVYERWIHRKDTSFVGSFWKDRWEFDHKTKFGQHRQALERMHLRYKWWSILEDAGAAGEGFGFGKLLVIDDYTGENFVKKNGGKYSLPKCIMVWCGVTGALMWVEECEEVDAQAYIRAIVSAIYAHGKADRPYLFMENTKAAIALRVIEVVKTMYSDAELQLMDSGEDELLETLSPGTRSPIIRNPSHIPTSMGKAFGERRMDFVNREFNPLAFPALYQSGNKTRGSAEMHISNQHWALATNPNKNRFKLDKNLIPTTSEYVAKMMAWAWGEYVKKPRKYLQEWAEEKGLPPTIESMINYYRPAEKQYPPADNVAYMLYWMTPKESRRKLRVQIVGRLAPKVNGRQYNLNSATVFSPDKVGRDVAVVPIPGQPDSLIIMLIDDPEKPEFLGVVDDFTVRKVHQVKIMRAETQRQVALLDKMKDESFENLDPALMIVPRDYYETPKQLPEAPEFMAEIAVTDLDRIPDSDRIEEPEYEIDENFIPDDMRDLFE